MHILIQGLTFVVVLALIADFILIEQNPIPPFADPSEGPWKNP